MCVKAFGLYCMSILQKTLPIEQEFIYLVVNLQKLHPLL
jgi:hypothetical protein